MGTLEMNNDDYALQIFKAYSSRTQIQPLSSRNVSISETEAYDISRRLAALRSWQVVGRKIGFTNKTIWPLYGVNKPMWGPVSSASVQYTDDRTAIIHAKNFCEPRLEPEIVLGFERAPPLGASLQEIEACIGWVAPGFEVVHSIYPSWTFKISDTIAAGGLHGKLIVGPKFHPSHDIAAELRRQTVILSRNDVEVEKGAGSDVLEGPVSAIQYLLNGIRSTAGEMPLNAGDIVTTGTMTDAQPLAAGDVWTANYRGFVNSCLKLEVN